MATQTCKAQKILQWRYDKTRIFTDVEIAAEIAMLRRKDKAGSLDCKTLPYFCRMRLAGLL